VPGFIAREGYIARDGFVAREHALMALTDLVSPLHVQKRAQPPRTKGSKEVGDRRTMRPDAALQRVGPPLKW